MTDSGSTGLHDHGDRQHAEAALPDISRLNKAAVSERTQNQRTQPVVVVVAIGIGFDNRVRRDVSVKVAHCGKRIQFLTAELVFEEDRIGGQVQRSARQLDGFNETRRVKIYIDVPNLPDGHTDMVSEPTGPACSSISDQPSPIRNLEHPFAIRTRID